MGTAKGFSQDDDETTIQVVFDGRTMDEIAEEEIQKEELEAEKEGRKWDRDRADAKEERMTTSVFFANERPGLVGVGDFERWRLVTGLPKKMELIEMGYSKLCGLKEGDLTVDRLSCLDTLTATGDAAKRHGGARVALTDIENE